MHPPVGGLRQVEAGEQVVRPPACPTGAEVGQPAHHHQVLPPGLPVVDGGGLTGEAEQRAGPDRVPDDVDAVEHTGGPERRAQAGRLDEHGSSSGIGSLSRT